MPQLVLGHWDFFGHWDLDIGHLAVIDIPTLCSHTESMAKSTPPPNVAIASLDARKQTMFNLMAPGPGTPWEDRGSIGVIGAFFKTCFKSMFKPAELLDSIRRPETAGDSFSFAIGCGVMWALSALMHGYLYYRHMLSEELRTATSMTEDRITVLGQAWAIWCVISAILAVIGVLSFQKIGSRLYYALVATEMKSKAPPILAYNIFGYCLGPSLLAIIPIAGPALAVIWIAIALMIGGSTRLKISGKGSVIASLVAVAAMLGLASATWVITRYIPPSTIDKQPP